MRLRMLGTGSSDGWPNPWCRCASCRAAAGAGVLRGQTSALVDDRLLVELGHDGVRACLRSGVDLTAVEAVLVTHAHPDHHAVPAWMWRGWAAGRRPLTLVGPAAVVAAARERLDGTVTTVEVSPGDRLTVAGYTVVVLPATHAGPEAGPAVLYDLTGPDGARLLWATDTGRLAAPALELVQDRAYDGVLLDLTSAHQPDHHDLTTWPEQVAELRRRGAVVDATAVHAVHLGHDNPPPGELDALLAGWGASAPRDGDVLQVGGGSATAPRPVRRVLVLGGARSGKSAWAERRLAAESGVTYVATAPPREGDDEWAARVQAHVARRPRSWTTVETAELTGPLRAAQQPLLIDDLGLWLTGAVDAAGAWEGPLDAVDRACDDLVAAWRDCRVTAVLVAPEVGSGVVPATASGRRFRDLLGALTARLAAASDEVVQIAAGLPRPLR
ncbi:MAG: bifunctional adenosylcobinamide kinase/adenosylcobinamide-phosphate guanylyltransferase [Mycobacteriales bacterium]